MDAGSVKRTRGGGLSEHAWLERGVRASAWDTALFAMKEAVNKAWAPLTGPWLGLQDSASSRTAIPGEFRAELRAADVPSFLAVGFEGRFTVHPEAVLATVAVSYLGSIDVVFLREDWSSTCVVAAWQH